MNQLTRILSIVLRLRDSNLRFKIVYKRILYNGYDNTFGDDIDINIFDLFQKKKPSQIAWEFVGDGIVSPQLLNTFVGSQIPLIISPNLDGLNQFELDQLQTSQTIFPIQHRLVTIYYRSNIDQTHPNWLFLPTDIRIDISLNTYIPLANSVIPF